MSGNRCRLQWSSRLRSKVPTSVKRRRTSAISSAREGRSYCDASTRASGALTGPVPTRLPSRSCGYMRQARHFDGDSLDPRQLAFLPLGHDPEGCPVCVLRHGRSRGFVAFRASRAHPGSRDEESCQAALRISRRTLRCALTAVISVSRRSTSSRNTRAGRRPWRAFRSARDRRGARGRARRCRRSGSRCWRSSRSRRARSWRA